MSFLEHWELGSWSALSWLRGYLAPGLAAVGLRHSYSHRRSGGGRPDVLGPANLNCNPGQPCTENGNSEAGAVARMIARPASPVLGVLAVLYVLCSGFHWCSSRSKSSTVFTGAKVASGTSTKTVLQPAMAPFQRPGRSRALSGRPSCDFSAMKTVE